MKMLLFDIDGTLLKTGGAGKIAFERVFLELFGIKEAWGELMPDGKTDPAIIHELCQNTMGRLPTEKEYGLICENYLRYFEEEIERSTLFSLMPGTLQLISFLADQKEFILGVATGNFEAPSWSKLKKGKIHHFFKFGGFGSDSHDRVELTRQAILRGKKFFPGTIEQIYIIGDTPYDIQAGKKSGAKTIGVATGSYSKKDLQKSEPDYVLEDFSDTEIFLKLIRDGSLQRAVPKLG